MEMETETACENLPCTSASTSDDDGPRSETMLIENMIKIIVQSPNAFFKSQQKNEPDLTEVEKSNICRSLLAENPLLFLNRYRNFLNSDHRIIFENMDNVRRTLNDDDRYEWNLYLDELPQRSCAKSNNLSSTVKNRRYAALKKLIDEGEYFDDYELRERDPLMFEEMIGQYQTEAEQRAAFHSGKRDADTLSGMFLKLYDDKMLSDRRRIQRYEQAVNREVSKSDDEDEDEESELSDDDKQLPKKIQAEEKKRLREEFIQEMQLRFLRGTDSNFDYRNVDENPDYDLLDIMTHDEEEKYFDADEGEDSDENLPVTSEEMDRSEQNADHAENPNVIHGAT